MKLSGAQAIIKVLLEQGVDTVFGYPGGQVIPLYNALYDAPLRNVLTAHEQGAIHAADGYARASGRTGVCIACLLYTSPSPRDRSVSRMPSSA